MDMKGKKLTAKQKAFVNEYLVDLNATQAAIRAGYSKKTAQEQSSRMLSNVMVQEALKELMDKRSEKVGLMADQVLEELKAMVMVPLGKLEENGMTCAAKIKAIELAMKHLRILNEKVDVGVSVSDVLSAFPDAIREKIKEALAKKLN